MTRVTGTFLLAVLLSTTAIAQAQQSLQERVDQQLQQLQRNTRLMPNPDVPAGVRTSFDYGLYLTYSFIKVDDAVIRQRQLQQFDLTYYARVNLDNVHDFLVRGVSSYREERPFGDPDQEGWDKQLDRLFYRFDLAQAIAGTRGQVPTAGLAIQLGRDLQYWGTGLVMATDVDAVTLDFTLENRWGLRLLAGRTPSDSIDIDTSRPGYIDHTHRAFYGALASAKFGNHRPFAYVLVQRDHNPNSIISASAGGELAGQQIVTAYDYNSVYYAIGATGALTDRLAYGVELVYESGSTLSRNLAAEGSEANSTTENNRQSRDDISAYAANLQLDYLFTDPRNTRLSGSFIYASGDSDRTHATNTFAGNAPDTVDQGFNAFGQLNTGIAFNPEVSNLIALRTGGSTFPFTGPDWLARMQVGVDLFAFFKADTQGGLDEGTTDERYIGLEGDAYLNWQITTDVTLAMRYGCFFPGSALVEDDDERHAFFVSVTFGL